jgi:hypothetical protein
MKGKWLFVLVFVLVAGYLALELLPSKPHDWNVGLSARESKPFGTKLLHERLPDLFPGQPITTILKGPKQALKEFEKGRINYIILTEDLKMTTPEAEAMLRFVSRGNNLFVAAEHFSGAFADSLDLRTREDLLAGLLEKPEGETLTGQHLMFIDGSLGMAGKTFPLMDNIPYRKFQSWGNGEVIGVNRQGEPVFVRIPLGEGQILAHSIPLVFSNYYMVDPISHQYISHALSYLPIQPVWWDEHFKPGNIRFESSLGYLLSSTQLRTAWILLLATLMLFVIFDGKRRQRAIPEFKPATNTTLDFVNTLGHLYLSHGDHFALAEKKIKYFLEHIRTRWKLDTQTLDAGFEKQLAVKSGVDAMLIGEVFRQIRNIRDTRTLDSAGLKSLNQSMESFKKQSQ